MISLKEIKDLELKYKKIFPNNNTANLFKYYTIAESLNRLNDGKTNYYSNSIIKNKIYNSDLTNEELYTMSNRFANQLLLESSPDDCFSVNAQQQANDNQNQEEQFQEEQDTDAFSESVKQQKEQMENEIKDGSYTSEDIKLTLYRIERSWNSTSALSKEASSNKKQYTIGELYVNGTHFCYTIEDYDFSPELGEQSFIMKSVVPGCVSIPTGTYGVTTNETSSRFNNIATRAKNQNYYAIYGSQKLKNGTVINMKNSSGGFLIPRLSGVHERDGILIHCGVDSSFSDGCILVVDEKPVNGIVPYSENNTVRLLDASSRPYKKLWRMLKKAQNISIEVKDDNMKTIKACPTSLIKNAITYAKAHLSNKFDETAIAFNNNNNNNQKNA